MHASQIMERKKKYAINLFLLLGLLLLISGLSLYLSFWLLAIGGVFMLVGIILAALGARSWRRSQRKAQFPVSQK